MPVFASRPSGLRPSGLLEFHTHGHGDFDDLPGDIGSATPFVAGMIPQFFSESNAITCDDWSQMTYAQRVAALTRWLRARGIWIFDVPATLGIVDDECARRTTDAANQQARAAAAERRAAAAAAAEAAQRERERKARVAAAARAMNPEGIAQHLLGQLGMSCATWRSVADPATRARNVQLSMVVSEAEAAQIRDTIDAYCSEGVPLTISEKTARTKPGPKINPTAIARPAGTVDQDSLLLWFYGSIIGGAILGSVAIYLVTRE